MEEHCTIFTVMYVELDDFNSIVGGKVQRKLRNCCRNLYSALGLTIDKVGEYTAIKKIQSWLRHFVFLNQTRLGGQVSSV